MKTMAENIKRIRTELGLTQTEFATKLGYDYRIVGSWENNRGKPSADTIKLIHELFNVDYEEIFDYEIE